MLGIVARCNEHQRTHQSPSRAQILHQPQSHQHPTFSNVGKRSMANIETAIRKMLSSSAFSRLIVLARDAPLMTRNDPMMEVTSLLVGGMTDDP